MPKLLVIAAALLVAPLGASANPCEGVDATAALPRRGYFAVGLAKSHLELDDERDGSQKSLLVRATGRRGFGVELELARARLDDDTAKTFGGALLKTFGKRRITPYIIAGGGRGIVDRANGTESGMRYGEAGIGLLLRKRRFAIGLDLRRGVRRVDPSVPDVMTAAAPISGDPDARERYTRGRILALVTF